MKYRTVETSALEFFRKCLACGSHFNVLKRHDVADCASVLSEREQRTDRQRRAA